MTNIMVIIAASALLCNCGVSTETPLFNAATCNVKVVAFLKSL